MELYSKVAYENSKHLTLRYSTSFGISSRFFGKQLKPHIYAIYALVRIADEIVDTYKGRNSLELLNQLEQDTYKALDTGYSTNPAIHAFALTARAYDIDASLITPFFSSMRMDLTPKEYSPNQYASYIHGSAEVVGLMCLKVFCNDSEKYEQLAPGAAALGSAYQKVNFLRDIAADYKELDRLYFPGVTFESFDDSEKDQIIADIQNDFHNALLALHKLPRSSRKATYISYIYYQELVKKLQITPVQTIKTTRIRVSNSKKLVLLAKALLQESRVQ